MRAHDTTPRLMLVVDSQRSRWPVLDLAAAAAAGGVDAIYLRNVAETGPEATSPSGLYGTLRERLIRGPDDRLEHSPAIPPLPARRERGPGGEGEVRHAHSSSRCRTVPTPTIMINDPSRQDWPTGIGLHLRESDPIPEGSTCIRGRPALVGRSVHSPESAAVSAGVDYVLAGHVYPSASKPGKPPLGLEGLAHIIAVAPCPVIAIGGITVERVADVLRTGAHGVAVIGAIAEAPDPYLAARSLRAAIDNAHPIETEATSMQQTETTTERGTTFEIVVNGKSVSVSDGSTIHDFLASKRLSGAMAIVERNGEIVPRGDYATTHVTPGDTIEVVHAVGGG